MSVDTCEHGHLARKCEVCERDDRIAALEATERELREAVKVLAVAADTPMAWKLRTCPECQKIRRDINNNPIALAAIKEVEDAAFGYPIAAAAVREASK